MTASNTARQEAKEIFLHALKAVDPYSAVRRFLNVEGNLLKIGKDVRTISSLDLGAFERILVVGAGKATAPMAKALEDIFGKRITRGIINVKYGFTAPLAFIETVEAGHPVPDNAGVEGTGRIMELLGSTSAKDLVFSLISGGGSALLPQPAPGISLEEKQAMTKSLIACGATIAEINAVRKHISISKGGQLAAKAFPATVINLMLSDVVGDRMDVIASGPFTPDMSTFSEGSAILDKYGLKDVSSGIRKRLEMGAAGTLAETPKKGDQVFSRVQNIIVGSNILALEAAEEKARSLGYETLILSSMIEGETREAAIFHAAIAGEIMATGRPIKRPACVISGGETTVTIRGKGLGGRNQEFCLASAIAIAGASDSLVIMSAGTDGNDGPTDAAGAVVDAGTVSRGTAAGMNASEFLKNNDSYHFLKKTGDLLITGRTNTNVMDLRLILVSDRNRS